jgi:hypothetical protein
MHRIVIRHLTIIIIIIIIILETCYSWSVLIYAL